MLKELTKCIVCESTNLEQIIDFGNVYLSGFVDSLEDAAKHQKEPFGVNWCNSCGMMQLRWVHDYTDLFSDYWYRSGINKQMVAALEDVVLGTIYSVVFPVTSWLDIANNDGTLSKLVTQHLPNCFMVGIDPAKELNNRSKEDDEIVLGNDIFINDFFSAETVRKHTTAKFDVISCIAMFYDCWNPVEFLKDIKSLLSEYGMVVCQLTDNWSMVKGNCVDHILSEHVGYYSLEILDKVFKMAGLEILNYEYNSVNGGSLRVYASHEGAHEKRDVVSTMIKFQKTDVTKKSIIEWEEKCRNSLDRTKNELSYIKTVLHKSIGLLGASTKGNTLLSLADIDHNLIDCALEVSPFKWGKYTLGSNIPIVNEKEIKKEDMPDYLLVPIWHFRPTLEKNFAEYIQNGGSLIFPLPEPVIVDKDGEHPI